MNLPLDPVLRQQLVEDHLRHPRGRGLQATWWAQVRQRLPTCGDEVTLQLLAQQLVTPGPVPEPAGPVPELALELAPELAPAVRWEGQGCALSQASSSMLVALVSDLPMSAALRIEAAIGRVLSPAGPTAADAELLGDAAAFVGVARYPARIGCVRLPWAAWRAALSDLAGRPLSCPAG